VYDYLHSSFLLNAQGEFFKEGSRALPLLLALQFVALADRPLPSMGSAAPIDVAGYYSDPWTGLFQYVLQYETNCNQINCIVTIALRFCRN
jgi:hypothetical protein